MMYELLILIHLSLCTLNMSVLYLWAFYATYYLSAVQAVKCLDIYVILIKMCHGVIGYISCCTEPQIHVHSVNARTVTGS